MAEKRKHVRTEFSGRVKVMHPQLGSVDVELRDISNGGVFLFTQGQLGLSVGEVVRVQAQDLEDCDDCPEHPDTPPIRAGLIHGRLAMLAANITIGRNATDRYSDI